MPRALRSVLPNRDYRHTSYMAGQEEEHLCLILVEGGILYKKEDRTSLSADKGA